MNPNYHTINAEAALADPDSTFYYFQKLIRLRKHYPVIVYGDYTLLEEDDPNLFLYTRRLEDEELLVMCNFSLEEQRWQVPERFAGARILITNQGRESVSGRDISLQGYEAVVLYRKAP